MEAILLIFSILLVAASMMMAMVIFSLLFLLWTRVPYVDTPKKYYNRLFDYLEIHSGTVVYDLGCGEGRFLMEALNKGAKKAVGYEISPWAYLKGVFNSLRMPNGTMDIRFSNFLKADISKADLVYIYLVGSVLDEVGEKLKNELKPGAQVVSLGFKIPGWKVCETVSLKKEFGERASDLYLYKN